MTMNLTIFTVFASLLIILSCARKPGEELRCTALRSVQKSDFIAVIITNPTPHPHLAATLLLLSAPSRDKISVVVKILPAANIRRRDAAETRRKAIAYYRAARWRGVRTDDGRGNKVTSGNCPEQVSLVPARSSQPQSCRGSAELPSRRPSLPLLCTLCLGLWEPAGRDI